MAMVGKIMLKIQWDETYCVINLGAGLSAD